MKAILTVLLFGGLILTVLSRVVPHPGESLPDVLWSELRTVIHSR